MGRNGIDIFSSAKRERRRVTMVTCYDYSMARLVDRTGIDAVLVDDCIGTNMLGYETTLPVEMEDILSATEAVARGTTKPLVVADLPFLSYQASFEEGFHNAGDLVKAGANAVKIQGSTSATINLMAELVSHGIPVIGHIGMIPQGVNQFGGYKVQGKEVEQIAAILLACERYVDAGVQTVVLECIPAELAKHITLTFPLTTIGIGAGPDCDGELQVIHDVLGLSGEQHRHSKAFVDGAAVVEAGLSQYDEAVKGRRFPADDSTDHISTRLIDSAEDLLDDITDSYFGPDGYIDN